MFFQVILVIAATAFITVPQWFSTLTAKRHAKRLAELRNGAPELYFEERRSLETYPPRGGALSYRLIGLGTMAYVITNLAFRH